MKTRYHLINEVILLLASVLVFRSLWLLLDQYVLPLDNGTGLWFQFGAGLVAAIISLYYLSRHE